MFIETMNITPDNLIDIVKIDNNSEVVEKIIKIFTDYKLQNNSPLNDFKVYGEYTFANVFNNRLYLHLHGYTIDSNTLVQLIFKSAGVSVTCGYVIYANDTKNINVVVLLKNCTEIIDKDCINTTCPNNYSSLFLNDKFGSDYKTVNPNILLIYANNSTLEFNDKGYILQTGETNKANSNGANSTVAHSTVANSTVANSTVANSNGVDSTVANSNGANSTVNGSSNKFTVDQEVKHDNKKCSITKVYKNTKKYDIKYDDGSVKTNVDESEISIVDTTPPPPEKNSFLSNYGTTAALGLSAAALGIGAYHLLKTKKKRKSKNSSPSKKQKRSSKKRSSRHRSRGRK
jgi:hypothetical protein